MLDLSFALNFIKRILYYLGLIQYEKKESKTNDNLKVKFKNSDIGKENDVKKYPYDVILRCKVSSNHLPEDPEKINAILYHKHYSYDDIVKYKYQIGYKPDNFDNILKCINSQQCNSQNKYIPPYKRNIAKVKVDYTLLFKQFRSLLNKLTVDNFVDVSKKIIELSKRDVIDITALNGISEIIFKKVISDSLYCNMYIDLLKILHENTFESGDKKVSLKSCLLNRSQEMFEKTLKGYSCEEEEHSILDKEELEYRFKQHSIGNIMFIGNMFNRRLFPLKHLDYCVNTLLDNGQSQVYFLELASKMISVVGKRLEEMITLNDKEKKIDVYFSKIQSFSIDKTLDARTRFMLLDLIDLRINGWVEREKQKVLTPKTIEEIRNDYEKESGIIKSSKKTHLKRSGSIDFLRSNVAFEHKRNRSKDNTFNRYINNN